MHCGAKVHRKTAVFNGNVLFECPREEMVLRFLRVLRSVVAIIDAWRAEDIENEFVWIVNQ